MTKRERPATAAPNNTTADSITRGVNKTAAQRCRDERILAELHAVARDGARRALDGLVWPDSLTDDLDVDWPAPYTVADLGLTCHHGRDCQGRAS